MRVTCWLLAVHGGGETTLALTLAKRYNFPDQSLDGRARWNSGWQRRDKAEHKKIVKEMVTQDRWIQYGTGSSTADIGFQKRT